MQKLLDQIDAKQHIAAFSDLHLCDMNSLTLARAQEKKKCCLVLVLSALHVSVYFIHRKIRLRTQCQMSLSKILTCKGTLRQVFFSV
jgi:hypothetical protein